MHQGLGSSRVRGRGRSGGSLGDGIDGFRIAVEEAGDGYLGVPLAFLQERHGGGEVLVGDGGELLEGELLLLGEVGEVEGVCHGEIKR